MSCERKGEPAPAAVSNTKRLQGLWFTVRDLHDLLPKQTQFPTPECQVRSDGDEAKDDVFPRKINSFPLTVPFRKTKRSDFSVTCLLRDLPPLPQFYCPKQTRCRKLARLINHLHPQDREKSRGPAKTKHAGHGKEC